VIRLATEAMLAAWVGAWLRPELAAVVCDTSRDATAVLDEAPELRTVLATVETGERVTLVRPAPAS
jgi:hypothetical protein